MTIRNIERIRQAFYNRETKTAEKHLEHVIQAIKEVFGIEEKLFGWREKLVLIGHEMGKGKQGGKVRTEIVIGSLIPFSKDVVLFWPSAALGPIEWQLAGLMHRCSDNNAGMLFLVESFAHSVACASLGIWLADCKAMRGRASKDSAVVINYALGIGGDVYRYLGVGQGRWNDISGWFDKWLPDDFDSSAKEEK